MLESRFQRPKPVYTVFYVNMHIGEEIKINEFVDYRIKEWLKG